MKNAFVRNTLVASLLFASLSAAAGGNDVGNAANNLESRLKSLNGRTGKIVDTYDQDNTGKCSLEVEDYDYGDGSQGINVYLRDTGMYFEPSAGITDDADYQDANTVIVSKSSDRPGGDACGDFGGAMGYKKILSLKGKKLTIRETFRCVLDGFEKYDIFTTCEF
ncbi:hypothetical protein [Bdellovibrio sp. HCB337]|uniref:hypothetical protein n=1 Tax=Bdellovibrio sp. HCB337 TaxID=3394358 RepID=UPI0039A7081A